MKKFWAMTLAITTLILSTAIFSAFAETVSELDGNLFTNGTLENKAAAGDWKSSSGLMEIDSHTGSNCMNVQGSSAGIKMYQEVSLEKGKTYTYSFWAKGVTANAEGKIQVCPYIEYVKAENEDVSALDLSTCYKKNQWVDIGTGTWTQITGEITVPATWAYQNTTFKVGINSVNVTYYVDDLFLGVLKVSDLAITGVTSSNEQNKNTTWTYDASSLLLDHIKETDTGYGVYDLTISFVNQLGTVAISAEDWTKMQGTCSTQNVGDTASAYALRAINTDTTSHCKFTLAPNSGSRNIEDFSVTATYTPSEGATPITKVFYIKNKLGKLEVSLSDGTNTIKEGGSLQNGTFTPSFMFYNKKMTYQRYMCLAALYEKTEDGDVLKDVVICATGGLDQQWNPTKTETLIAVDTLTISDAENSYVKAFIWHRGNGTTEPTWELKPILEPVVIG